SPPQPPRERSLSQALYELDIAFKIQNYNRRRTAYTSVVAAFQRTHGLPVPSGISTYDGAVDVFGRKQDLGEVLRTMNDLAESASKYNTPEERQAALYESLVIHLARKQELQKQAGSYHRRLAAIGIAAVVAVAAAGNFVAESMGVTKPRVISYLQSKSAVVHTLTPQEEQEHAQGSQEYKAPVAATATPGAAPAPAVVIDPSVSLYNHVMGALDLKNVDQRAARLKEVLSGEGCAVLGTSQGILTVGKGSRQAALQALNERIVDGYRAATLNDRGRVVIDQSFPEKVMRAYNLTEIPDLPNDVNVHVKIPCGGTK
ncbi:MAG: hypothetical protein AABX37_01125, partial [Nanoarchaeota archaeon]